MLIYNECCVQNYMYIKLCYITPQKYLHRDNILICENVYFPLT